MKAPSPHPSLPWTIFCFLDYSTRVLAPARLAPPTLFRRPFDLRPAPSHENDTLLEPRSARHLEALLTS